VILPRARGQASRSSCASTLAAAAVLAVACGGTAATSGTAVSSSSGSTPSPSAADVVPSASASSSPATPTPVAEPPHIMVVVLENREYDTVIGSAPQLTALARSHGLATQAFAMGHPSEPNYIALITGSTQGITDDGDHVVDAPSLPGQLHAKGIGWRAYMGGLPAPCDTVVSAGAYAKKHDPFLMVKQVVDDSSMCGSVVPQDRLAGDLAAGSAPPFLWVSPDLCADGHDCSTAAADTATAALVAQVTSSSWYARGGTIVILWDEGASSAGCCQGAHGGHVAVIGVSQALAPRTTLDTPLDHAGVLRGIEEAYSLPVLADAGCACSGDLTPLLRPRG
jgi:hypothetical protein